MGILARLNACATSTLTRRKVNDEIWLLAETHFTGSAMVFVLKGMCVDASGECSNYMEFTVETQAKYRCDRKP
jgi:hypothetical protein